MASTTEGRVAVYIDFDNIVISRFEQENGRTRGPSLKLNDITAETVAADSKLAEQLDKAQVDLGAVLDFASSFGALAVSRAYADWSLYVNSAYREQLMKRAVDLVQLFPAVRPAKNGADIRLAVDVVEDLYRLPDLTHVVIVAGDSDYIPVAQLCKRLGRFVVGIGVAGATSRFLASACDVFADYDTLPGVDDADANPEPGYAAKAPGNGEQSSGASGAKRQGKRVSDQPATNDGSKSPVKPAAQRAATDLLRRALRLGQSKDDVDWMPSSAVKNQMLRMDPSFQESALGYKTFTEFVKSRHNLVELKEEGQLRLIRLRVAPE